MSARYGATLRLSGPQVAVVWSALELYLADPANVDDTDAEDVLTMLENAETD